VGGFAAYQHAAAMKSVIRRRNFVQDDSECRISLAFLQSSP
jgi:hypothetical protein